MRSCAWPDAAGTLSISVFCTFFEPTNMSPSPKTVRNRFSGAVKLAHDCQTRQMNNGTSSYRGHRFPPEIISHSVWLYHRFCLSFRDVEDLLAERGITVSYETVRQWCRKFGTEYARRLRRRQVASVTDGTRTSFS